MKTRLSTARKARRQAAFTMVEIAIALGVIGFALVAIIGILPMGLNVQKDNREDTIISQDAPYFLETIRNGLPLVNPPPTALDFLTNYVQTITVTTVTPSGTNLPVVYNNDPTSQTYLQDGQMILGLLSTPEIYPPGSTTTNYVTAQIQALNGSALEQNGANPAIAFRYAMDVEILPFNSFSSGANSIIPDSSNNFSTNRAAQAKFLGFNLFELRLRFTWPILPNGSLGPNHATYRTLVGSRLRPFNSYWFFQPLTYTNSTP